jgi:hypothetical protein
MGISQLQYNMGYIGSVGELFLVFDATVLRVEPNLVLFRQPDVNHALASQLLPPL